MCSKTFSSQRYLKVHVTRIHTEMANKCENCDFTDHDKINLRAHMKQSHSNLLDLSSESVETQQADTNNVNDEPLLKLEKTSWEEKRVDDQLMDADSNDKKETNDDGQEITLTEIIDFRDEQTQKREQERANNSEEVKKNKVMETNQNQLSQKKSSRKRKKKSTLQANNKLPDGLRHIPDNIKHLTNDDDLILSIVPDGSCGIRAGAAHIFEDQNLGSRFRSVINTHIIDRFSVYSKKIAFPYRRQVGGEGKYVVFEQPQQYMEFLLTDPNAVYLWSDSEEFIAISNLYQMEIRIITTKGPDDNTPLLNIIKPDSELQQSAFLPPGKVPVMVLLHSSDSHFDLIVSRDSRIAKSLLMTETAPISAPTALEKLEKEHKNLKEKFDKLKTEHNRCLETIETLKNELTTTREETENDTKEINSIDPNEEQILLNGKLNGYSRESPQSNPTAKSSFKCNLCNNTYKTQAELAKHKHNHTSRTKCKICETIFRDENTLKEHTEKIHTNKQQPDQNSDNEPKNIKCNNCETKFNKESSLKEHLERAHTNDGDWNCDDCDHQTNSMSNLKKHLNLTHHKSHKITPTTEDKLTCKLCTTTASNETNLKEHMIAMHKSYKPCRNLPNCQFGNDCIFNHNEISKDMFLCYECGNESTTLRDLMFHRKNKHTVSNCLKYLSKRCIFNNDSCWFNHPDESLDKTDVTKNTQGPWQSPSFFPPSQAYQSTAQSSVFQEAPTNLAPPSVQPTQATWLQMLEMMRNLKQMMEQIKQTSQFQ